MMSVAQHAEPLEFRPAMSHDLPAVIALTARARNRLASWSPQWWGASEGADAIHAMWLEHLVANQQGTVHVATSAGQIVGCVGISPQPEQWFLDDMAVQGDERWPEFVRGLVRYVDERPALTCLSPQDRARTAALDDAECHAVSSYWIRPTTNGTRAVRVVDPSAGATPRPPHTFGGAPLDHAAACALAFTSDDGTVIGSAPMTAPPVYNPGGTVTVADLVAGPNRRALLDAALDVAGARGDVLLCVVCGRHDAELTDALEGAGFARAVDVHQLPHA